MARLKTERHYIRQLSQMCIEKKTVLLLFSEGSLCSLFYGEMECAWRQTKSWPHLGPWQ